MRALIATLSAAVLGLSSLTMVTAARADSFSIAFPDASFSWSDDEYSDSNYNDTPIVIVNNGSWTPPRGYYRRHYDRDYKRHGYRHGHKHYRGHKHRHHKRRDHKRRW